jgi:3-oxoacyl-[acyl-carrier protein] reductase
VDLAGKTVLLTGASKGIGAEIAIALGSAGANLIAH